MIYNITLGSTQADPDPYPSKPLTPAEGQKIWRVRVRICKGLEGKKPQQGLDKGLVQLNVQAL